MKKIICVVISVLAIMLTLCSCGTKEYTQEEISQKIDAGEFGTLYAYYSVENEDSGDFYVQFDSSQKDFDYYSANGTKVKFYGEPKVYDAEGNVIDRSTLKYGEALLVVYDGKIYDKDPVTIKAAKVSVAPKAQ